VSNRTTRLFLFLFPHHIPMKKTLSVLIAAMMITAAQAAPQAAKNNAAPAVAASEPAPAAAPAR